MKLLISKLAYDAKPNTMEVRELNDLRSYEEIDADMATLIEKATQGHAWMGGTYENGTVRRAKTKILQVSALALDFDGADVDVWEVVKYAETCGVPANGLYYSYSQRAETIKNGITSNFLLKDIYISKKFKTIPNLLANANYKDGQNFRIVWELEEPLSAKEAEDATRILQKKFSDVFGDCVDPSTKDSCRIWYGGQTEGYVFTAPRLSLAALGALTVYEKLGEGKTKAKVIKNKTYFVPDYADVEAPARKASVTDGWWERLRGRCPLWDMWENQEYMDYNQRLHLIRNVAYLQYENTSKHVINDFLSFFDPSSPSWEGHTISEAQIRTKFREALPPLPCVFAAGTRLTMYEFFSGDYEQVTRNTSEKCSSQELDEWMDANLTQILNAEGFHYFQSQTGSGKTERVIRDYASKAFNIGKEIYAVPTHLLAKEFEERLRAAAPDLKIVRISEQEYTDKDKLYLKAGAAALTQDEQRKEELKQLFSKEENGVFIITHSLFSHFDRGISNATRIIVDENIENTLIQNVKITVEQLDVLKRYVIGYNGKQHIEDMIAELEKPEGTQIENTFGRFNCDIDVDEYVSNVSEANIIENVLRLGSADKIMVSKVDGRKCLRALFTSDVIRVAFEKRIPVKLLTATPMTQRLKDYYGDICDVISAPTAQNTGCVKVYREYSGARGTGYIHGMTEEKFDKALKVIRKNLTEEQIANSKIISFKDSDSLWKQSGFDVAYVDGTQIHLQNSQGLDKLKGEDVIVVGKFDRPHQWYKDLAADLGIDIETLGRQNQRIELNGISQTLYLYTDERLRNEQIQYIAYALGQSVGRARALRTPANVYVFSNFVPSDWDEVYD